jgi:hypothetical protein
MVHGLGVTTVKGDIPYNVMRIKLKGMARSNWSSSMVVVLVGILAFMMGVSIGVTMGVSAGNN